MSVKQLTRSPLFLATLGIWFMCFSIWTVVIFLAYQHNQVEVMLRGATCDAFGCLMCGGFYLVLRRLEGQPLPLRFATALMLTVLGTAIYTAYSYAAYYVI